jgi:hypothetical protein
MPCADSHACIFISRVEPDTLAAAVLWKVLHVLAGALCCLHLSPLPCDMTYHDTGGLLDYTVHVFAAGMWILPCSKAL